MNTPQCTTIIRFLATGRSLTTMQAFSRWRITTLSQRCGELRERRWPIHSKMVTINGKRVARYSIPAAKLARVAKRIQA